VAFRENGLSLHWRLHIYRIALQRLT
jgi:hypothetical protein